MMLPEDEFFYQMDKVSLWQRYCGFLDLSVGEFMDIQEQLLLEQLKLVADSPLGKKVMNGAQPKTVAEFRRQVPLTEYQDYEPYLTEKREEMLAERPCLWCHSSGRGGRFKWIPYTKRAMDVGVRLGIALLILSCADRRGQVVPRPGMRMLLITAPPPYASGSAYAYVPNRFTLHYIPPLVEGDTMQFQERVALGFKMALRQRVDVIFALGSVLVKVGAQMSEEAQNMKLSKSMLRPGVIYRLARAFLSSRIAHRPILPRDLWNCHGLMTAGTDASIYKDDIAYYWGHQPYEVYGSTEAMFVGFAAWNRKWLTLTPDFVFWEFIPEEERLKGLADRLYQPSTVLINELQPGQTYELVLSHLYGMPLLRYRMKDLIRVVALRDEEANINLPQIMFKARVDDVIDLAGLTQLDEAVLWQAIKNTGIRHEDWLARKEYAGNQTYLRLYIELKDGTPIAEVEKMVDTQLRALDIDYRDIGDQLKYNPVKVILLPRGTFQAYYEEKQKEGADLAHLKPPHMNASDAIIGRLLQLSQER